LATKTSRTKSPAEKKEPKEPRAAAKKAPRKSKGASVETPPAEVPPADPHEARAELDAALTELDLTRGELTHAREEAERFRRQADELRQEAQGTKVTLELQAAALAESRGRYAVLEEAHARLQEQHRESGDLAERLQAQAAELELAQARVEALQGELEELDLLREDLEESIIDRRREVKALRQSEREARQFAEECGAFRSEAETRVRLAESVAETMRTAQQQSSDELKELRERLAAEEKLRLEATANLEVHQGAFQAARRRLLDAERRATESAAQVQALQTQIETLKAQPAVDPSLQRRCELLQLELNNAVRESADLERAKTQLEFQKRQLQEELARARQAPSTPVVPVVNQPSELELELRQHKLRADELRESLRKQRQDNERLQERLEHLMKAKEQEEQQRKEIEYKLRVALRNQARG